MSAPVDVLAEDEDGMPVGYATWYNRHASGRVVDTSRDHDCEAAWREGAQQARAAVAELIQIQRRLVAWNRNVNGEGSELAQICADAEAALSGAGA